MRWYDATQIPLGEKRTRGAFLWRAKRIAGETRWLERAAWVEEWRQVPRWSGVADVRWMSEEWVPVGWAPDNAYKQPTKPWPRSAA